MPSSRRQVAGAGLLFAGNGATFAALLPWYPLLTRELRLGPAEFGLIVACFAVGAILSSTLPAPLIRRFGPLPVCVALTSVLAAAVAAAAWAPTGALLALCLFAAGFADAVVDVAQNVVSLRAQTRAGRPVLSSMHALWSLGGVAGGAVATAAAASGVDMWVHLVPAGVVGVVAVGVGAWLVGPMDAPSGEAPPHADRRLRRWAPVLRAVLPLVVIAVAGTMLEDVANNWAALSAVELGGVEAGAAGIAFTVVIGSQSIGRFTGDALIHRFGRAAVARTGGALVAAGGLGIVSGQSGLFFAGLAAVGLGCATLVPSALTAASRVPGLAEGTGVMIVSWLMRLRFLGTSPLVGAIADGAGLRAAMLVLMLAGVAVLLLGQHLGGGDEAPPAP
jgi:MFS family permease